MAKELVAELKWKPKKLLNNPKKIQEGKTKKRSTDRTHGKLIKIVFKSLSVNEKHTN